MKEKKLKEHIYGKPENQRWRETENKESSKVLRTPS
jgi:hypothetical protein